MAEAVRKWCTHSIEVYEIHQINQMVQLFFALPLRQTQANCSLFFFPFLYDLVMAMNRWAPGWVCVSMAAVGENMLSFFVIERVNSKKVKRKAKQYLAVQNFKKQNEFLFFFDFCFDMANWGGQMWLSESEKNNETCTQKVLRKKRQQKKIMYK